MWVVFCNSEAIWSIVHIYIEYKCAPDGNIRYIKDIYVELMMT